MVKGRGHTNGRDKKEFDNKINENSRGNNMYQLVNQNINDHQYFTGHHSTNIVHDLIFISSNLDKKNPSNPEI
jgi:hypothetical protein